MILTGNISYAQFQSVVDEIGATAHVFYRTTGTDVTQAAVLFQDREFAATLTIDPVVSVATFTTDFPTAIEANVSVSE